MSKLRADFIMKAPTTPICPKHVGDATDALTTADKRIVRRGEAQLERRESKSWSEVRIAQSTRRGRGSVDSGPIIIPTLFKQKIARYLSYPIGAEQISVALASTPQIRALDLCFFSYKFDHYWRRGNYEFLRVGYSTAAYLTRSSEWGIRVQPVPRILRHRINGYIVETALPQMAHWLAERADLEQRGSDSLVFYYDEKGEEFVVQRLTGLQPLTDRS